MFPVSFRLKTHHGKNILSGSYSLYHMHWVCLSLCLRNIWSSTSALYSTKMQLLPPATLIPYHQFKVPSKFARSLYRLMRDKTCPFAFHVMQPRRTVLLMFCKDADSLKFTRHRVLWAQTVTLISSSSVQETWYSDSVFPSQCIKINSA